MAGCSGWGNFWQTQNETGAQASVPAIPTGLTFSTKTAASISLTWGAVQAATGYKIYRASTSGGALTLLGSPGSIGYADTGLTANTQYYYKVSALNAAGESLLSAEVAIATYSIPSLVNITPADGATGVGTTTNIVLTFSEAINPSTVDATSGGPCAAQTVLVSSNNFVNCYGMTTSFSGGNTIATLVYALWPGATTIKVRITTAVQSANGVPLGSQYTSTTGFTTP